MQRNLILLGDCPKPTQNQKEGDYMECAGRVEALEELNKAKRLPKNLNLYSANLYSANLYSANLYSANLYSANLTDAENLTNEQIKSACFWEKAYFAKRWDEKKQDWIVNEPENKKRIAELKADKSSDPETPVHCSM